MEKLSHHRYVKTVRGSVGVPKAIGRPGFLSEPEPGPIAQLQSSDRPALKTELPIMAPNSRKPKTHDPADI